jgi:hypothetical protein
MELVQMHFSELIKVRGEDPEPLPRDSTCMTSGMHMHRDLKTPNEEVVNKLHTPHLVENLCVKLTDFGLSKTKLKSPCQVVYNDCEWYWHYNLQSMPEPEKQTGLVL